MPPLFISTPYDQQKSLWTRKEPSLLVLNRISGLAKNALEAFNSLLLKDIKFDFKYMFRPPLSAYDYLIYLKPAFNPRRLLAIDVPDDEKIVDLHPYKPHSLQKIPVTDFDPVQCFLRDLRVSIPNHTLRTKESLRNIQKFYYLYIWK